MADGSLTEFLSTSSMAVFLPEEMLAQMALGLEPLDQIAGRFGYDGNAFQQLFQQPWFQQKLDAVRTQLRESGLTTRLKAKLMAEDLMVKLFLKASDPKAQLDGVLATTKFMVEMADIKPKGEGQANEAFKIVINTGGAPISVSAEARTGPLRDEAIDVTPRMVLPFGGPATRDPEPIHTTMPQEVVRSANSDLAGGMDVDDLLDTLP